MAVGHGRINSAYAICPNGLTGSLETVRHLTEPADQLPDQRQLPRLHRRREQARRRLGRHRPPLLQQEHRLDRDELREHRPPARLPAPDREEGARLRPLPPHRLRPLPPRAPAVVRLGDEAAGVALARADEHSRPGERDHAPSVRRGRSRRPRAEPERHLPVRDLRLGPAARARLPGEDPERQRLQRALDVADHDRPGRAAVHEPGRPARRPPRPRSRSAARSASSASASSRRSR